MLSLTKYTGKKTCNAFALLHRTFSEIHHKSCHYVVLCVVLVSL